MTRVIQKIILHASDSDVDAHDNINTIRMWHIRERGWIDVGYHYFIRKNGTVEIGRLHDTVGAHCVGHNKDSLGICFSGSKHFYLPQFATCRMLLQNIFSAYNLNYSHVYLHNELDAKGKTCPNFTMKQLKGEM